MNQWEVEGVCAEGAVSWKRNSRFWLKGTVPLIYANAICILVEGQGTAPLNSVVGAVLLKHNTSHQSGKGVCWTKVTFYNQRSEWMLQLPMHFMECEWLYHSAIELPTKHVIIIMKSINTMNDWHSIRCTSQIVNDWSRKQRVNSNQSCSNHHSCAVEKYIHQNQKESCGWDI